MDQEFNKQAVRQSSQAEIPSKDRNMANETKVGLLVIAVLILGLFSAIGYRLFFDDTDHLASQHLDEQEQQSQSSHDLFQEAKQESPLADQQSLFQSVEVSDSNLDSNSMQLAPVDRSPGPIENLENKQAAGLTSPVVQKARQADLQVQSIAGQGEGLVEATPGQTGQDSGDAFATVSAAQAAPDGDAKSFDTASFDTARFDTARLDAARLDTEEASVHVVQANDSFWSIAQASYGSGSYFNALIAHNRHMRHLPDRLSIGDQVLVPSKQYLEKHYPDLCPQSGHSGHH